MSGNIQSPFEIILFLHKYISGSKSTFEVLHILVEVFLK